MRFTRLAFAAAALAACACGQQYEIGGLAGGGFLPGVSVTAPAGAATTGFKPGMAFGAVVGHNLYSRLGGEIGYTYRDSPLRLTAGGTEATFAGMSHSLHYDVLLHPKRGAAAVQPFVALGGGVRIYQGTGKETAYQPLSQYAYLTKTRQVEPLVTGAAGVKFRLGGRVFLRAEFRDYASPFPNQVIAPVPGAKTAAWIQDFVPMVGISYGF